MPSQVTITEPARPQVYPVAAQKPSRLTQLVIFVAQAALAITTATISSHGYIAVCATLFASRTFVWLEQRIWDFDVYRSTAEPFFQRQAVAKDVLEATSVGLLAGATISLAAAISAEMPWIHSAIALMAAFVNFRIKTDLQITEPQIEKLSTMLSIVKHATERDEIHHTLIFIAKQYLRFDYEMTEKAHFPELKALIKKSKGTGKAVPPWEVAALLQIYAEQSFDFDALLRYNSPQFVLYLFPLMRIHQIEQCAMKYPDFFNAPTLCKYLNAEQFNSYFDISNLCKGVENHLNDQKELAQKGQWEKVKDCIFENANSDLKKLNKFIFSVEEIDNVPNEEQCEQLKELKRRRQVAIDLKASIRTSYLSPETVPDDLFDCYFMTDMMKEIETRIANASLDKAEELLSIETDLNRIKWRTETAIASKKYSNEQVEQLESNRKRIQLYDDYFKSRFPAKNAFQDWSLFMFSVDPTYLSLHCTTKGIVRNLDRELLAIIWIRLEKATSALHNKMRQTIEQTLKESSDLSV